MRLLRTRGFVNPGAVPRRPARLCAAVASAGSASRELAGYEADHDYYDCEGMGDEGDGRPPAAHA